MCLHLLDDLTRPVHFSNWLNFQSIQSTILEEVNSLRPDTHKKIETAKLLVNIQGNQGDV